MRKLMIRRTDGLAERLRDHHVDRWDDRRVSSRPSPLASADSPAPTGTIELLMKRVNSIDTSRIPTLCPVSWELVILTARHAVGVCPSH